MANARGKAVDNTHLSLDFALQRGFIHRDYLAHCLRWSHVSKWLRESRRYQTYHVLDIGCGRDLPLPRMLYSDRMTHTTGSYTGVDVNPLERPKSVPDTGKFNMTLLGKTNFVEADLGDRSDYDLAVSFEVLEHVEPEMAHAVLSRAWEVLDKRRGTAFVSTPCYDPRVGAADNHVNEMSVRGLGYLVESAGFRVARRWGTFASQRDYKHLLKSRGLQQMYEELSSYYDSNVLACVFAPLFPDQARNCLWQLEPQIEAWEEEFPWGDDLLKPEHSSSKRWAEDVARIREDRG